MAVHEHAKRLARREGVSVQRLISMALAEKMSVLDADTFFKTRAARASREKFDRAMARIPARKPLKGDEFPNRK